jgi:hypothetical protein
MADWRLQEQHKRSDRGTSHDRPPASLSGAIDVDVVAGTSIGGGPHPD